MTERSVVRIIAGFGRSGTTWVQDVLATANSLRAVFEPLHPKLISEAVAYAHRYRTATHDDPELYQFFNQYFHGNFHSLWADYRVVWRKMLPRQNDLRSIHNFKRILSYSFQAKDNILRFRKQRRHKERIVKLIRANMMLSWLQENFNVRIVVMIRHPAAVVVSQMQTPQAWSPQERIARYRSDPELLDALDDSSKQLIFQSLDDIESYTLSWCIENAIAIKQAQEGMIPVVYYEKLVESGKPEWQRILNALELRIMPDDELISRPSQQTWGEKAASSAFVHAYSSWMSHIDASTADRIQSILDATGIDMYTTSQAFPLGDTRS